MKLRRSIPGGVGVGGYGITWVLDRMWPNADPWILWAVAGVSTALIVFSAWPILRRLMRALAGEGQNDGNSVTADGQSSIVQMHSGTIGGNLHINTGATYTTINQSGAGIEHLRPAMRPALVIDGVNSPIYRRMDLYEKLRTYKCYINVRNISHEAVRGVNVKIIKFDYGGSFDLFQPPQIIAPMAQTINPGETQPWLIAVGSHYDLGEDVNLSINRVSGPYRSTAQKTEITFEVSGETSVAKTRDFLLLLDREGRPSLVPVDEIDQAELDDC